MKANIYQSNGTRRLGNKRISRDHSDDSVIKISQNTEKSPGNLRKLIVSQASVKSNQLTDGLKMKINCLQSLIVSIISIQRK